MSAGFVGWLIVQRLMFYVLAKLNPKAVYPVTRDTSTRFRKSEIQRQLPLGGQGYLQWGDLPLQGCAQGLNQYEMANYACKKVCGNLRGDVDTQCIVIWCERTTLPCKIGHLGPPEVERAFCNFWAKLLRGKDCAAL